VALPVPKRSAPASAMATRRKLVSESFSGTSMRAWPCASSFTVPRHSSSVSNSSRVGLPPPSPLLMKTSPSPRTGEPTVRSLFPVHSQFQLTDPVLRS
jgi:hypothetical protein